MSTKVGSVKVRRNSRVVTFDAMKILALKFFGNKIFAECKDGLLTVTLPKNTAAIPKQIEVTVK